MPMQVKRLADGSETWLPALGVTRPNPLRKEAEIPYLVLGVTTKEAAILAVLQEAPKTLGNLTLENVRTDEYEDGALKCTAVYSAGSSSSDGSGSDTEEEDADGNDASPKLSVSISTSTVHIVRAIRQWRAGGAADNMNGMIGWNGQQGEQADFAGVDIPVGQCNIQYSKRMRIGKLTASFATRCALCAGKVNASSWKGWPAGSLMFTGQNYQIPRGASDSTKVTVTWDFIYQPGGTAKVNGYTVKKKGWEYAWGVPPTAGTGQVLRPYVAQVLEYVSFSTLGI